jgi:hypothetical protein
MKYTATQLATALGVQTSTVTRHIKKGKLSAAKNDNGEYEIDAAEIVRAYPDRATVDDAGNIARQVSMQDKATGEEADAIALWRTKLEAAERLLVERERAIDDLRQRLDAEAEARRIEGEERRKLTALLTDQRQPHQQPEPMPPPPRKGLWAFLHRLTG